MAESAVPTTEMASVRTVAPAATRRNPGERSGGKRPRTNAATARRFAGSRSDEGSNPAPTQQRMNAAPTAPPRARRFTRPPPVQLLEPDGGHFAGGKIEEHPTAPQPDDAREPFESQPDVVQQRDQRAPFADPQKQIGELPGEAGIERGKGLVGEHDRGILHQHAGEGDALLLPS